MDVDRGIGFLVVGGEGEGGFVGVDVLAVGAGAAIAAVVAGEAVVPLVVFEGPDA